MRSSLIVSAVIGLVFGMLGWRENHHAATLRMENQQLRRQAADLGIPEPGAGQAQGKRTKRNRTDREAETMDCFRKLVSVTTKMEENEDGEDDPALQAELVEVLDLLYSLDGKQVRALVAAIQESQEMDEEMKESAIGGSIMILGTHHPAAAAAIFTDSPDLVKDSGIRSFMVDSVVMKWGEHDPLAAIEWIRSHQAGHPELITEETLSSLISGTAVRNPKLAFQFIGDLGIEDPEGVIYQLGASARNGEQRDALIQALKEIGNSVPAAAKEEFTEETLLPAISAMAEPLVNEGFEVATSWIESADLDEQAKVSISGELSYSETMEETGRWIEWLGGNLTSPIRDSKITDLMRSWTRADHRAAAAWLQESPESPARQTAVLAYAHTLARHDPEAATRWAETIANPEDRAAVMRRIRKTTQDP